MKKVLIFGGTGFIGRSLAQHLSMRNLHPILVARNRPSEPLHSEFVKWDGKNHGEWQSSLEDALAIVNLAGKSVDCIKSKANCDIILNSRVDATNAIGEAMKSSNNPPKVWIQMSTAHIYGDPTDTICNEDSDLGEGFAPMVGTAWEATFKNQKTPSTRGVILRTSFVIGKNGGALESLKRIVSLRLGGTVGQGSQGISWIHEYDMNEIIYQSIINENYEGTYIASAPNPVSNKEFMSMLRKTMRVKIGLPAPEFLIRLGSYLIFRTDPELALYGRYVKSLRLEESDFEFKFPDLLPALEDLIG